MVFLWFSYGFDIGAPRALGISAWKVTRRGDGPGLSSHRRVLCALTAADFQGGVTQGIPLSGNPVQVD